VVGQSATKAKHMAAVAVNGRHNLVKVLALDAALHSIFAVWSGAPLQVLFIVDVRSCEECVVSGYVSVGLDRFRRI
jgi:hypothetical protein